MLKAFVRAAEGLNALPKLQSGKHNDQAFLCPMWDAAAVPLRGLRFRERAYRQVLWRLRKTRWGSHCSSSARLVAPTTHRCRGTPPAHGDVLRSGWLDCALF